MIVSRLISVHSVKIGHIYFSYKHQIYCTKCYCRREEILQPTLEADIRCNNLTITYLSHIEDRDGLRVNGHPVTALRTSHSAT
jgi:hypothetical protein